MSTSSTSLQSIIHDAERLSNRLKDHQALADRILAEAEGVNNQLEAMRQVNNRSHQIKINKSNKKTNDKSVIINSCFSDFSKKKKIV